MAGVPALPAPPATTSHEFAPAPFVPRPAAAFALSLLGGLFILLAGIFQITVLGLTGSTGFFGFDFWFTGFLGILLGAGIMCFAVLFYELPRHTVAFGSLIVAFAAASYLSFFGGFLVGLVFGVVGGILAIVWRPAPFAFGYFPPVAPQRICLRCGRTVATDARFCAYCGNTLA